MATTPLSSNWEKKMKSTKIKSIPLDIIFEIFSWLPVKSLIRYRCVSKFYNSLVSESNFVDLHHCHSMTRPNGRKYLVHPNQSKEFYTLELKEDEIGSFIRIDENLHKFCEHYHTYYHPICVNGLVCVWKDMQHVVICNASTREVRFLPSLNENIHIHRNYNFYFYSIGFEPKEKKHKICLSINYVSQGYTRNWILTLATDKSWREIKSVDCFMSRKRVYLNGVIYILSYEYLPYKLKIVAFDVGVETFRILTCPYGSIDHNYDYKLIEVKGKLAVLKCKINDLEREIKLWILTQNDDWESHMINIPLQWKNFGKLESLKFVCTSCEDIIFESNMKFFMCYNITRKNWREFKVEKSSEKYDLCNNIFGYVESLYSLEKTL